MRVEVVVIRECLWKKTKIEKKNKEIIQRFQDLWKNFHSYLWFRRKLNKTWQWQYKWDTPNYINCSAYCECCKKRKSHATKTLLLALGVHGLTSSLKIIVIVRKLEPCILWNSLCDMGAAQIYCSLVSLKKGNILPLQSSSVDDAVWTFWREGQSSYHLETC